jgi:hypothetical protein
MTMASDDKKTKAAPAPKSEAPAKTETVSSTETAKAATKTEISSSADTAKAAGSEAAAAPASYSRGEGQKPVTAAYKENWNAIFGKKSSKKKKR